MKYDRNSPPSTKLVAPLRDVVADDVGDVVDVGSGPLAHFAYIATVANTVLFSRRTRASRLPRVWVRVRVALQAKHSDSGGCL